MENVFIGITLLGLFILLLGLFLQLKRAVNQDISIFFKLRKNRIFAGLSLLVFTLILQLVGAIGLSITYDHEVNKSGEALRTLTKTTDVALSSWVKGWESRITAVSSNPLLQNRTLELITESEAYDSLIESDNLIWSREAYERYSSSFGSLGFFITSLEGINLSSTRDENIAKKILSREKCLKYLPVQLREKRSLRHQYVLKSYWQIRMVLSKHKRQPCSSSVRFEMLKAKCWQC
ncbi:hypothetical protein [Shewanella sp. GutDb-MelDb]|uniref:hypothetical protein n=1 Tax=Shewanella sp. GutDb-MelDb TaxID=2058316 RepID=UPI000C7E7E2C|nr:hypothetical protein [Shewanella sp. GutDb-MelDb]PKG58674.1 hypothetical protein CXF82_03280 [Shewanella sp. GutDb-MelDb]